MHLFSKLKICSIQILLTGFIRTTKIKNISKCRFVTEHSMHVCFLISKIWNNCINQMHTLRLQNPWQQVNNLILILFLYSWPHLALVKNQVANNLLFFTVDAFFTSLTLVPFWFIWYMPKWVYVIMNCQSFVVVIFGIIIVGDCHCVWAALVTTTVV